MENCLVTKLKGVVDNSNLQLFGYLRITRRDNSGYYSNEIIVLGNATFTLDFKVNGDYVVSVTRSSTGVTEQFSAGSYSRDITGDYAYINWVSGQNGSLDVRIDSLPASTVLEVFNGYFVHKNLAFLGAYGRDVMSSIKEYSYFEEGSKLSSYLAKKDAMNSLDALKYINLFQTNIDIDITDSQFLEYFGKAINMTLLSLKNRVYNWSELAAAQVANGRSSGEITVYDSSNSKKITFDPSASGGYIIEDV